jgi:hypothetical protein
VTVAVDPAMFDSVTAFFSQEKSGAEADLRTDFAGSTARTVEACRSHFARQLAEFTAQAAKECGRQQAPCTQAFTSGQTSFELTIGGTTVRATSAKDCAKALVPGCRAASLATFTPGQFAWSRGAGGDASAATAAACPAGFQARVAALNKAESARLLHHEQVHFNVTNDIAVRLRKELRDTAATLSVTAFRCGKAATVAAAVESFASLGATQRLRRMWDEAHAKLETTQSSYDTQTNHGLVQKEQDKWSARFP